jgi:hypothetical protein
LARSHASNISLFYLLSSKAKGFERIAPFELRQSMQLGSREGVEVAFGVRGSYGISPGAGRQDAESPLAAQQIVFRR